MTLLNNEINIKPLEDLILVDNKIIAVPFAELNKFPQEALSIFCHKHALYQLPTTELIDFIKNEIGDTSVIEIGSGNGCIGRSLGIKMTDNRMQERPDIKAIYALQGQPVITYGQDVETIAAIDAVKKYNPKSVVACWVTHKHVEGLSTGNMFGVEEELLFENGVEKYVHVGNQNTHFEKPILKKYPVQKYRFPWILSRSMRRDLNEIYIFTK